jgi:hypothetical protein
MHAYETNGDTNHEVAEAISLAALGWVLADDARARRLLDLTGLDPAGLRARIGDPALHDAVLAFLEAHQPDLVACAAAIGVAPAQLARIAREDAA